MKTTTVLSSLVWVVLLCSGCRSHTLRQDQAEMRKALLDLYSDQVMDNLIRTAKFKPVVQIDFKTVTGTVTDLTKGSAGYGRESDRARGNAPGLTIKTTPTITGEQDLTTQLTITGDPVTDPKIYLAYEQFLWGPKGAPDMASQVPDLSKEKPLAPDPASYAIRPAATPPETIAETNGRLLEKTLKEITSRSGLVLSVDVPAVGQAPKDAPVPQGILIQTDDRPDVSKCQAWKRWDDGKYYYVPTSAAGPYFALYKRVVLDRATQNASDTSNSATKNVVHQLERIRLDQLQLFR